ncbi:hypothetical protein [Pseudochrobactrum sp. HB0163]|uniref:hypothetical protein n=1 Tax=Pseudochrobactrum sp. HB0163 TaxID=3450708 RepID=UPI003F6DA74B
MTARNETAPLCDTLLENPLVTAPVETTAAHGETFIGCADTYTNEELVRRLGEPVIIRGSNYPADRSMLSLSFHSQNGEIIRIQMKQEEARLLQNILANYLLTNTRSQYEKSSGIPIDEVSRPQDGRKV